MDDSLEDDDIAPLRPTPKPRRIITTSLSLTNLSFSAPIPIPKPRQRRSLEICSSVKLRSDPPARGIVTAVIPCSRVLSTDDEYTLVIKGPVNPVMVGDPSDPGGSVSEPPPSTNQPPLVSESCAHVASELDSIRIDMEDITSKENPADDDDHSKAASLNVHQLVDGSAAVERRAVDEDATSIVSDSNVLDDTIIRMGPEWSVPQQYSSSPIVKELAESMEHRPPPPSSSVYSMAMSRESPLDSHLSHHERLPSLLERIIRSHTIWYLPHIGRPTATHLLRHMEPGNFIVRAASRSSCMAISVRLSDGFDMETDHYIIQVGTGRGVRLENSPFTFQSLPYLLEHYCMHGDELQLRLRLPSMILACKTTKALQSLALMGQDFWTSDMSQSRSASRASQRISSSVESAVTSFIGHHPHAVEVCHPIAHYAVNDAPRTSMTKKRPSNGRSDPSRFATIHGDLLGGMAAGASGSNSYQQQQYRQQQEKDMDTHSPPTKHERAEVRPIARTERRSQSVRASSHKNDSLASSSSAASSSIAPSNSRRSFLRNLFGSKGDNTSSTSSSSAKQLKGSDRLAQCQSFVPIDSVAPVKGTRSAYDIGDSSSSLLGGTSEWARRHPSYTGSPSSSPARRDEQFHQKRLSSQMLVGGGNGASSMKTFKPIAGYDEVLASARVRPLPMRRERSDLCTSSTAVRLARHNEGSPGPAPSPQAKQRQPMRPTAAAMDPQATKNCVEELRRKRLQSTNEMLNPGEYPEGTQSATASPKVSMRNHNLHAWAALSPSSPSSPSSSSWRGRTDRLDHRLSVPNLAAEPPSMAMQSAKALKEKLGRTNDGELGTINEGLITPVVRRKHFDQPSSSSHLRHHDNDSYASSTMSSTSSSERSDTRGGGTVARGRETLEALFSSNQKPASSDGFTRKYSSERRVTGSSGKESELVWRRSNTNIVLPTTSTRTTSEVSSQSSSSRVQPPTQQRAVSSVASAGVNSNRGSVFIPPVLGKANGNWSAINSELKSRQKIAKVRPTPQQRTSSQTTGNSMTIGGGVAVVPCTSSSVDMKLPSEYAQLTDLSGIELFKQDNAASIRDDDNVSVAGTVFNEPWDSNVWENLLDLAHHGDEGPAVRRLADPILEEDSDSDRTAGGSTQMAESDDDDEEEEGEEGRENEWNVTGGTTVTADRRPLPSDRITTKGWDHGEADSKYSTLDSRLDRGSISGSLRREMRTSTPPNSMMSLPRAVSRFSQIQQVGSIDDLPTTVPSLSPILGGGGAHQKMSNGSGDEPGVVIQQYVERLSYDNGTIFGATLRRFIECTVESDEADPGVVVRNVRQFINGIKNYLVKHGEGELHQLIEHERNRLNANQILSIDAILEAVLHKLLLKRVKPHLYHVMVCEHSRTGALEAVAANIRAVRGISIRELGFTNADQLTSPSVQTMENIKMCLRKMQSHYSPLKKLENLLRAIGLVLNSQQKVMTSPNGGSQSEENADIQKLPAADDLVRWLVFILARTSTVGCEVEAWYMWELLPQHMLTQGDASYYLTALFSAVHVLKSMDAIKRLAEKDRDMINSIDLSRQCCSSPSGGGSDAFLKVAIPDVNAGCIRYATFPGVPQMTTSKLCRVIAHQQGITNPEDFGLYLVLDGFETPLQPADSPDHIRDRMREQSKNFLFAYKRHDAKIAWPSQVLSGLSLC